MKPAPKCWRPNPAQPVPDQSTNYLPSSPPLRINLLAVCLLAFFLLPAFSLAANRPVQASGEEIKFALSLKNRAKMLDAREQEINARAKAIKILAASTQAKLEEIKKIQQEITTSLQKLEEKQSKDFNNLIKVFGTMSASKVAPLLNKMEDRNVAKILRALKKEQVAKIIPKLDPEKAVRVSRLLGRISWITNTFFICRSFLAQTDFYTVN